MASGSVGQGLHEPDLELIDPTPDIHALFMQFNTQFFESRLGGVTVEWSKRMTSCAGLCYYQGRVGGCRIKLSEPLLALRPRSDLIDTLIHEMIHAYLFVTGGYSKLDRDGHGKDFQDLMRLINAAAGTRITIYHSFHDEVDHHRKHIWLCDGPCAASPPYFGLVKRAMNRAPGPNDLWWMDHKARCSGNFQKIKEPPPKPKVEGKRRRVPSGGGSGSNKKPANGSAAPITAWLQKTSDKPSSSGGATATTKTVPSSTITSAGSSSTSVGKGGFNQSIIDLVESDNEEDEELKRAIALSLQEEVKKPEVKKEEVKKPEVKKEEVKKPEVKKEEVKKPEVKQEEVTKGSGNLKKTAFSTPTKDVDPRFPGAGYRLGG